MIKPIIDFTVFSREGFLNPTTLFIADNSSWVHLEDDPSIIEIQVPGSNTHVVNYFDKNKINNFNSINLGLDCPNCDSIELNELPDGIYNITLKASPSTFYKNKKHLRTTKMRIKLAEYLMSNSSCSIDKEVRDKVLEISLLLDSAEANIMFDNIQQASDLYQIAKKKLGKLSNCKNCF